MGTSYVQHPAMKAIADDMQKFKDLMERKYGEGSKQKPPAKIHITYSVENIPIDNVTTEHTTESKTVTRPVASPPAPTVTN